MSTMVQAIRMALHVGESRLGVTDIFGEDVGPPLGGVFTATQGLKTAWNSPLDERGIVGTAIGLALAGQKPVPSSSLVPFAQANVFPPVSEVPGLQTSKNPLFTLIGLPFESKEMLPAFFGSSIAPVSSSATKLSLKDEQT